MTETRSPLNEPTASLADCFDNFPVDHDDILTLAEQSAGIGIWHLDLGTGRLHGTAQYFRMLGLPGNTGSLTLDAMEALRHPDDRDRVRDAFRIAAQNGSDRCDVAFRIVRPDGETRWMLGRGQIIRDRNGTPVRYAGVNVDITDSKRAEAALRESEARFRRVFEQSPLGKATADRNIRLREVNPALCCMIGCPPEALIGRGFLDLVHPDDRPRCAEACAALLSGALPQFQVEQRFLRHNGDAFWVNVNIAPIRDLDGHVLYTLGIIEDIDDRKRITEALQDSERRLRELNEQSEQLAERRGRQLASSRAQLQAFFDNSPDWLTLIRATPDGRFVYVNVNPATEIAYGRPRAHIVGRTVEDILGAEQAQVPLQMLRDCLRTGTPQRYVAHRTLAGRTTTIDVMFVAVPPHDDSGERHILSTARDLTDREQLEAQLRQAQKMEAIGKLTGGVAHDFNNLLAVIAGNAELARRADPARLPRMLDNILRASERGVALTRQLLSFSRRQSANPQVLDLRTELPRVAEMLRASLRGDIQLQTTVAADVWPVEVDVGEFEIAVLNIAANARDAMPNGGTFAIEAANRPAGRGRLAEPEHVAIVCSDTGSGIPAEALSRIFDPFFTTKAPGEGTGLGLSQVYGFAQQSGGTVRADSVPGKGTRITLWLPRARKPLAAADAAPGAAAAAPPRHARILLVEDNPEVAAVTVQMLDAMGLTVATADRAQAALDWLDSGQRCDLLLTDVVMPGGMTGLDLAKTVRRRFPALPIILVSGYNDVFDAATDRFLMLRKPVPFEELARSIAGCLEAGAAPGPGNAPGPGLGPGPGPGAA